MDERGVQDERDAEEDREAALRYAAQVGDLGAVEDLLDLGVHPDAPDDAGFTPLHYAMTRPPEAPHKDHLGVVRLLIARGADPQATACDGGTLLIAAAASGLADVVAYLLDEEGARIDATLASGAGALHALIHGLIFWDESLPEEEEDEDVPPEAQAVYDAYLQSAQLLIARGIDLGATLAESGQTPLFGAAAYGLDDLVEAILASGRAAVDARDAYGLTPLAYAARSGAASTVSLLLEAGADPDAQDPHGFTPLHHAVVAGDLETVQALVEGGARPHPRLTADYGPYRKGATPLDLARQARKRSVAGYLSRQGG